MFSETIKLCFKFPREGKAEGMIVEGTKEEYLFHLEKPETNHHLLYISPLWRNYYFDR